MREINQEHIQRQIIENIHDTVATIKAKKKRIKEDTYEICCRLTKQIINWLVKVNEIYFSKKEENEKLEKGQTLLKHYNFTYNRKKNQKNKK